MSPKQPHPGSCPNCTEKGAVTYERFSPVLGTYVCDKCGWSMDAHTGEIINKGEQEAEQ